MCQMNGLPDPLNSWPTNKVRGHWYDKFLGQFIGRKQHLLQWHANLGSVYFDVKWFSENDFFILRCLLRRKIMVKRKYFPFDQKFFFNFRKMVYGFNNCKPFSDFEQNDVPCQGMLRTLPRPARDFTRTCPGLDPDPPGTCSGLDRDLTRTHLRLDRDSPRTWSGPAWDLTSTYSGLARNLNGTHSGLHRDLPETSPGHAQDFTGTYPGLVRDLPKTRPGLDRYLPGSRSSHGWVLDRS